MVSPRGSSTTDHFPFAAKGLGEAREKSRADRRRTAGIGSNDPILDILHTHMRKTYPEFYIFSSNTGSSDGLKALNMGYTDIGWSHLFDPKTGDTISLPPHLLSNVNRSWSTSSVGSWGLSSLRRILSESRIRRSDAKKCSVH